MTSPKGILLVNKPRGKTSFALVSALRKILNVKKIGFVGTLDPFATGVMVMLIGREFTRLADQLHEGDKEYLAEIRLGAITDTYDCDGQVIKESHIEPSPDDVKKAIAQFQGEIEQIPPMFSAKKVNGKKLYELARKGEEIERKASKVHVHIELISYNYPLINMRVICSKGTYIRTLAYDIGNALNCGGHLVSLCRSRCGKFSLNECLDGNLLNAATIDSPTVQKMLRQE